MILEARYIGPFEEVTVPGFEFKTVKNGEATKLRVPDGSDIGGCWEIIAGKDEYDAARAKADAAREARVLAREKAKAAALEEVRAAADKRQQAIIDSLVAGGEVDATAAPTKKKKPAQKDGE